MVREKEGKNSWDDMNELVNWAGNVNLRRQYIKGIGVRIEVKQQNLQFLQVEDRVDDHRITSSRTINDLLTSRIIVGIVRDGYIHFCGNIISRLFASFI
jgi:hypothetical protein